jgi:hypothetical protein
VSLVASVIVSALPLIGGVQLDADAQGRAVLGWQQLRGPRFVVEVADVRAGHLAGAPHRLWRSRGNADLDGLDVAGSGAAVACLDERRRSAPDSGWRLRVALRPPGGRWSPARVVARTGRYLDHVTCGVSDAGDATLAWMEGRRARATHVSASGVLEPPVTVTHHPVDPPVVQVAPDGSAAVVYSKQDRVVRLVQRSADGSWSKRTFGPEQGFLPQLAMTAAGQPIVAWRRPSDELRMVAGPAFAPAVLTPERDTVVGTLTASARGDVLATWITHSSAYAEAPSALVASVSRPGGAFSPGVSLGPLGAYPVAAALAPDGSGAVGWYAGTARRAWPVVRALSADGRWGPPRALSKTGDGALTLAGAPGGAVTVAWTERRRNARHAVLRLAQLGAQRAASRR